MIFQFNPPYTGEQTNMIITLSEPVQKPLEQTELVVITERVDDVVLLLGQMMKTGLLEIVDDHLPQYWSHEGVELGLEGDDLAGVHGVNRPGSRIGLDQYGTWGQIKVKSKLYCFW
jgi:hypothetical protein